MEKKPPRGLFFLSMLIFDRNSPNPSTPTAACHSSSLDCKACLPFFAPLSIVRTIGGALLAPYELACLYADNEYR